MPNRPSPRVAILGFSIECNKFAPVATKAHFLSRTYLEGDGIIEDARAATPRMLPETPGFVAAMDASGTWTPVGVALAMTEPNGPVEHAFFVELLGTIERRLAAALPVDAVYICSHGAALTTEEDDPDGVLFAKVRGIVGPNVPIAATLDLHANVSERMVASVDACRLRGTPNSRAWPTGLRLRSGCVLVSKETVPRIGIERRQSARSGTLPCEGPVQEQVLCRARGRW